MVVENVSTKHLSSYGTPAYVHTTRSSLSSHNIVEYFTTNVFCVFFSYAGTLNGDYVGFDWFAASIFLLMRGSLKKTWDYLKLFSTLLLSAYLWTPQLHLSVRIFPVNLISILDLRTGPSISEHN